MPHFLASLPFDHCSREAQWLVERLASLFWKEERILGLVQKAGLSLPDLELGGTARITWMNVLTQARAEDKLGILLDEVAADSGAAALRADLASLRAEKPEPDPLSAALRSKASQQPARGWGPGLRAFELTTGATSSLVGIGFLSEGLLAARSVGRLRMRFGADPRYASGTGFLIAPDLVLTNHHCLFGETPAGGAQAPRASVAELWLDYEILPSGALRDPVILPCDVSTVTGDEQLDWAVVRLAAPVDQSRFPPLPLSPSFAVREGESVCIVQHPLGQPKQIGILRNLVVETTDTLVRYLTDTDFGSSGSPVFDKAWRVVALHHASWSSDGDPPEIRNEGIRIDRVAAALRERGLLP